MRNKGFTLIETLVAITILMIGVLGPLSLAARGIADGFFAQNELTASLLASEAIETITNRRDGNVLEGNIWNTGIPIGYVHVEGADGGITTPNCVDDLYGCPLKPDGNGIYTLVSGNGFFERQIFIAGVDGPGITDIGRKVTVTMHWKNKTVDRFFTLTGYIYAE